MHIRPTTREPLAAISSRIFAVLARLSSELARCPGFVRKRSGKTVGLRKLKSSEIAAFFRTFGSRRAGHSGTSFAELQQRLQSNFWTVSPIGRNRAAFPATSVAISFGDGNHVERPSDCRSRNRMRHKGKAVYPRRRLLGLGGRQELSAFRRRIRLPRTRGRHWRKLVLRPLGQQRLPLDAVDLLEAAHRVHRLPDARPLSRSSGSRHGLARIFAAMPNSSVSTRTSSSEPVWRRWSRRRHPVGT